MLKFLAATLPMHDRRPAVKTTGAIVRPASPGAHPAKARAALQRHPYNDTD